MSLTSSGWPMATPTRAKGFGTCVSSQLRIVHDELHSMWNGRIGWPVAPARKTAPGCATLAGPRGPSRVKAAGFPAASSRRSCTSARAPPRELEPRAVPYPKRPMIPAIHSPSKFWLVMTMMPRCFQNRVAGRIRPCQNAKIGGFPAATIDS